MKLLSKSRFSNRIVTEELYKTQLKEDYYFKAYPFFIVYSLVWKLLYAISGINIIVFWPIDYAIIIILLYQIAVKLITKRFPPHNQIIHLILSIMAVVNVFTVLVINDLAPFLGMKAVIASMLIILSVFDKKELKVLVVITAIVSTLSIGSLNIEFLSKIMFALSSSVIIFTAGYISFLKNNQLDMVINRNQSIDRFASMNSHDIRGPIARLLGLLQIAKLENQETDLMRKIKMTADELDDIVKRVQKDLEYREGLDFKRFS